MGGKTESHPDHLALMGHDHRDNPVVFRYIHNTVVVLIVAHGVPDHLRAKTNWSRTEAIIPPA